VSKYYALKAYGESAGKTPRILNIGTGQGASFQRRLCTAALISFRVHFLPNSLSVGSRGHLMKIVKYVRWS